MPPLLMGIDKWLELLLTGPRSVRRELLEKCSDYAIRRIQALRAVGVDLIAYTNPVASATFISAKQFHELAAEWVARDWQAGGPAGLVSSNGGARLNPTLKAIEAATGAQAFSICTMDDIAEARQKLNGEIGGAHVCTPVTQ